MTLANVGIFVASAALVLNAYATFSARSARKLANYQELIKSHREIWKMTLEQPNPYQRVLESHLDLEAEPVSYQERRFVSLLFLHMTTAYALSKRSSIMNIEQLKRDFNEVMALPIPAQIWVDSKSYFNRDFVSFVDDGRVPSTMRAALKRMPWLGSDGAT